MCHPMMPHFASRTLRTLYTRFMFSQAMEKPSDSTRYNTIVITDCEGDLAKGNMIWCTYIFCIFSSWKVRMAPVIELIQLPIFTFEMGHDGDDVG